MQALATLQRPNLAAVLVAALRTGARTRQELERTAALDGFTAVQVELLLSRFEREGLVGKSVSYVIREEVASAYDQWRASIPVEPPPPARPGRLAAALRLVPVPAQRPKGPPMSPFWAAVRERAAQLQPGECMTLERADVKGDNLRYGVSNHLRAWQMKGRLTGVYRTHVAGDAVIVTRKS